jgi:putative ABC transport system permease protein
LIRLVVRELRHERSLALCSACVVAATLAPLWTLWGLERGVVGTLIERQNRDPVMRQVLPESTGAHRFDRAWFDAAARWDGVAFVTPNTRAIANQVDLVAESGTSVRVDLIPTAEGDPLLSGVEPPARGRLVLSAAAELSRVLPADGYDGLAAFVALDLLEDIQSWRDGYTVPALGDVGAGPAPKLAVYPLFRMYASSIREVSALAQRLEDEGIAVYTRSREIAATLGLQRNLRVVLAMVGVIAVSGAVAALVAMQVATLRRKRRDYALLKLVGHGRDWLIALPCVHALAVASLGAVIALCVYFGAASAINAYFADHLGGGEKAVQLRAHDVAWGFAAALGISVLPALWGGWRASRVEAADELRET